MKTFCEFITEQQKSKKYSKELRYFIQHLMSDSHGHHTDLKEEVECPDCNLDEVNVLDHTAGRPKRPIPNLTAHPAVNQARPVEDREHVERYQRLMANGARIGSSIPNIHKHMKSGHDNYMSGVQSGEDPRVTQKTQLTRARGAFRQYVTDKVKSPKTKPKFLSGNTKTDKNMKLGDSTAGMNLSPAGIHGMGGHNACPNSTKECRNSCLAYTTGQNAMLSNINSKIGKHHFAAEHPEHHVRMLHTELLDHVDQVKGWNAEKKPGEKKMIASYRPNMVTDYNYSHMHGKMLDHVHEYAKKQGVHFQVRDYTKNHQQLYKDRHPNHFLALSHTGQDINPHTGEHHSESNDEHVSKALNHGHTVAAVVSGDATHMYDHKTKRLYPMADGDSDDQIERRHSQVGHIQQKDGTGVSKKTLKPTGVVSVLRVKGSSGEAKKAAGNFENQTTDFHHPEHGPMRVVEINKKHASAQG